MGETLDLDKLRRGDGEEIMILLVIGVWPQDGRSERS